MQAAITSWSGWGGWGWGLHCQPAVFFFLLTAISSGKLNRERQICQCSYHQGAMFLWLFAIYLVICQVHFARFRVKTVSYVDRFLLFN